MSKTILLSGAIGSGKSTVMGLGYRALSAHWGPTASIDTDAVVMMVDPRWELPDEERRYDLVGWQVWLLANAFLSNGFECVLIGGNGLHSPPGLDELIALLLTVSDVYHVTLDPSPEVIQQRVAERGGSTVDPGALSDHIDRMRATYRDWTCRIDNSHLSPRETVAEIAARVSRGHGRLTGPIRGE